MNLDDLDLRRREGPRGQARWFRYTSASALGLEIAVAIVGSTLAARWVESHWTHWAPWTTLSGLLIGCGAAGLAIARTIREQQAWEAARSEIPETPPLTLGSGDGRSTASAERDEGPPDGP